MQNLDTQNDDAQNDDAQNAEAQKVGGDLKSQASAFAAPGLAAFAELYKSRAASLKELQEGLNAEPGENAAQVLIPAGAAEAAEQISAWLETEARREEKRPKVGPNEWAVFGRVFDALGQPGVGLQVRLYDQDRFYDDLLGETVTNEFGDFAISYSESDFKELCEGGGADLYVMVKDAAGNALYSSTDSVRPDAGQAEFFEIRLSDKSADVQPKPKGRKRKDN